MVKNRLRILENKMATLEERFQDALGRWKENCRRNSFHSSPRPYLDCDSYREIVSIGVSCLPLIRDQLHQEIETEKRYDNELKRLKIILDFSRLNLLNLFFNLKTSTTFLKPSSLKIP